MEGSSAAGPPPHLLLHEFPPLPPGKLVSSSQSPPLPLPTGKPGTLVPSSASPSPRTTHTLPLTPPVVVDPGLPPSLTVNTPTTSPPSSLENPGHLPPLSPALGNPGHLPPPVPAPENPGHHPPLSPALGNPGHLPPLVPAPENSGLLPPLFPANPHHPPTTSTGNSLPVSHSPSSQPSPPANPLSTSASKVPVLSSAGRPSLWSDLFARTPAPCVTFPPPTLSAEGIPVVKAPPSILLKSAETWKDYIVCYFFGIPPSHRKIFTDLNPIWGKKGEIQIRHYSPRACLILIPHTPTREWVLNVGFWSAGTVAFSTVLWSPATSLSNQQLTSAPVWLSLHGVPPPLWSPEGFQLIASGIGKPLPSSRRLPHFGAGSPRIRALVSLENGPLPSSVIVEDDEGNQASIGISYPNFPPLCPSCSTYGHRAHRCPLGPQAPSSSARSGTVLPLSKPPTSVLPTAASSPASKNAVPSSAPGPGLETGPPDLQDPPQAHPATRASTLSPAATGPAIAPQPPPSQRSPAPPRTRRALKALSAPPTDRSNRSNQGDAGPMNTPPTQNSLLRPTTSTISESPEGTQSLSHVDLLLQVDPSAVTPNHSLPEAPPKSNATHLLRRIHSSPRLSSPQPNTHPPSPVPSTVPTLSSSPITSSRSLSQPPSPISPSRRRPRSHQSGTDDPSQPSSTSDSEDDADPASPPRVNNPPLFLSSVSTQANDLEVMGPTKRQKKKASKKSKAKQKNQHFPPYFPLAKRLL